ncbi:vacuolar protein sorting-associated protein, putative [Eimeria tenella]|uniref:Vacuolar protein sorting-associated protein, putative n=1 Tax=Eimeria tenella TaxID=5802 RepID=U6L148_EIMTE|nr:vacuolar protein sorting-associated protein, putative [Eimeria tenella]CDJ42329.1 vacuolar protein sorting-associated protein, putative [Eimeria tenella]|eukprot:XP_013233079.1 vacuolar protein sorting-associated protein, putative [Eimeria tenella]
MAHELLGIRFNRIDLSKSPTAPPDLKEVLLDERQDLFYRKNCMANFGELGVAVKQHVNEYQEKTKASSSLTNLEALKDFVEKLPESRRLSSSVFKHVGVISELSRIVRERNLLVLSELEQSLACSSSSSSKQQQQHFTAVCSQIQNKQNTNLDKLRLALLYCIRYEGSETVAAVREELAAAGLPGDSLLLLLLLLQYSSKSSRSEDLFRDKSLLQVAKNLAKGLQGVANVYTQHKSLLSSVVESLIKGKLKESTYAVLGPNKNPTAAAAPREGLQTVLVFVIGGATYQEEREMQELSSSAGVSVLLGGSSVVNAKQFLADVAQVQLPNV